MRFRTQPVPADYLPPEDALPRVFYGLSGLPKTLTGKIRRSELKQRAWKQETLTPTE